jgi:8-oxo-dGTP pyrophosphatase MutT (NUDIX family)
MTVDNVIRVSAVVLRDADGAVLTVRKRGTVRFMLPGGKPEPGESAAATAVREIREEVGIELELSELRLIGEFRAHAANERDHFVESTVFAAAHDGEPSPAAEIAELRWASPQALLSADDTAPLLKEVLRTSGEF